jgi:hypothetical protein
VANLAKHLRIRQHGFAAKLTRQDMINLCLTGLENRTARLALTPSGSALYGLFADLAGELLAGH